MTTILAAAALLELEALVLQCRASLLRQDATRFTTDLLAVRTTLEALTHQLIDHPDALTELFLAGDSTVGSPVWPDHLEKDV